MGAFPQWYPYLMTALFGLCVGSFLNVCIVRLPRRVSVATPPSHCPQCQTKIRWYDNIPLLSFVALGGRCRRCGAVIGWRYPAVELLTAGMAMLTYAYFPEPWVWALWFLTFVAPLLVITFIDLEHRIIPDLISLPGIVVGLAVRVVFAYADMGDYFDQVADGVLGLVVGGGTLFIISWVYYRLRKHEGIGGGDIKLAAMLGAFLGWKAVLCIFLLSSVTGSVVGLVTIGILRKGMRYAIPFGPFLAFGALVYLFWGEALLTWYLSLYVS